MNPKNNYIYDKGGANLSVIKIESIHCWCCGKQMDGMTPENIKTEHHAIPEELKPIRNVKLPICRGCHAKIHEAQGMQPHDKNRIVKNFDSLQKQYDSLKNNLEKIRKDLFEDNEVKQQKVKNE